jgi:hypothetical protein
MPTLFRHFLHKQSLVLLSFQKRQAYIQNMIVFNGIGFTKYFQFQFLGMNGFFLVIDFWSSS